MPLTKRQKRRLRETSKMIESTIYVKNDMVEIQFEYAQEIESVVNKIRSKKVKLEEPTPTRSDLVVSDENIKETSTPQSEQQPPPKESPIEPKASIESNAPDWVKKLWKNIAKKCHPDRLNMLDVSAIDAVKRRKWFLESKILIEKQAWAKLLHIGVQLDEWVDELSHAQQQDMLAKEYNANSRKIEEIQSSLAWQWGTHWDKHDVRIKIIIAICNAQGVTPPSTEELIKLLINLELD